MKTAGQRPNASQILYNGRGMFFHTRVQVETDGRQNFYRRDSLAVTGADEAVLIYTAASSYNGFDKDPVREGADARKKAAAFCRRRESDLPDLLDRHHRDHRGLSTA